PVLIVISMVFPIVQLVVLGYAFGGNVKHLKVGVVDQDHRVPAVRLRELCGAVGVNAQTFETVEYSDQGMAVSDLRNGLINVVLTMPPDFPRRALAKNEPRLALIEDNTDNFISAALAGTVTGIVNAYNTGLTLPSRIPAQATLDVVEVYPYVPYIQYLLPGSI